MNHGEYRILNKKLDAFLRHSHTFSRSNFENMVSTHQDTMQTLTDAYAKTFQAHKELIVVR